MHRSVRTVMLTAATFALVAGCNDDDPATAGAAEAPTSAVATTTTSVPVATTTTTITTSTAPTTTEAVTTTTEATTRPVYPGRLEPDTYANKKFLVPVTFTVEQEWDADESTHFILLLRQPVEGSDVEPGELAVQLPPDDPTVDEVVELLRTNPGISFSEPAAASAAGLDGVVLTAEGSEDDVNFLWLSDPDFGGSWFTLAGLRHEVYVLDNAGTTVMIWIDAFPEIWEAFRADAQRVIDSIDWAS